MGVIYQIAAQRSAPWAAKGGKTSRRRQRKRMLVFANYLEREERVDDWRNVGRRHVIRFYKKRLAECSTAVRNQYYNAINHLFRLVENSNGVPRPFPKEKIDNSMKNKVKSKDVSSI